MKAGPWSWIMIVVFMNAMITLFGLMGAFGAYAGTTETDEWAVSDILGFIGITGFTGVGTLGVVGFTSIVSILSGISPFVSLAYGLVVGLYVNTFLKISTIMDGIATSMGTYSFIMYFFITLTLTAFAYLIIKTLVDMSASPGYGGS